MFIFGVSGEKPFHCVDCNKDFTDHRNYKRHRLIHENIYPYACVTCDKRYRHSNSLKAHLKTHGQEVTGPLTANNPDPTRGPSPTRRRSNVVQAPPTMVPIPYSSHLHLDGHLADAQQLAGLCSQIQGLSHTLQQNNNLHNSSSTTNTENTTTQASHVQQSDHLPLMSHHDTVIQSQINEHIHNNPSSGTISSSSMPPNSMALPYAHTGSSLSSHNIASTQNLQTQNMASDLSMSPPASSHPPPAHDTNFRKSSMLHPQHVASDLSRFCSMMAPPLFGLPSTHDVLHHSLSSHHTQNAAHHSAVAAHQSAAAAHLQLNNNIHDVNNYTNQRH